MADQLTDDQKTILDQKTQIDTLTGKLTQKEIDLRTAIDQIKTLETANATLISDGQRKDADLQAAATVVTDLKAQLSQKADGTVELPTVKVGPDTFELVGGPFTYLGREITLEVLNEEPKLAAELVKEGATNLRKLAKKAKA